MPSSYVLWRTRELHTAVLALDQTSVRQFLEVAADSRFRNIVASGELSSGKQRLRRGILHLFNNETLPLRFFHCSHTLYSENVIYRILH